MERALRAWASSRQLVHHLCPCLACSHPAWASPRVFAEMCVVESDEERSTLDTVAQLRCQRVRQSLIDDRDRTEAHSTHPNQSRPESPLTPSRAPLRLSRRTSHGDEVAQEEPRA